MVVAVCAAVVAAGIAVATPDRWLVIVVILGAGLLAGVTLPSAVAPAVAVAPAGIAILGERYLWDRVTGIELAPRDHLVALHLAVSPDPEDDEEYEPFDVIATTPEVFDLPATVVLPLPPLFRGDGLVETIGRYYRGEVTVRPHAPGDWREAKPPFVLRSDGELPGLDSNQQPSG
jgi:hypothetical protein